MDYDFDIIERLIDLESQPAPLQLDRFGRVSRQNSETDTNDHRAGRASSRSRRSRSRSRSGHRRRSRSRSRRDSRRSSRDSSDRGYSERRYEEERRSRLEESRKKDNDRTMREDCSVMVMGLHPSLGDREVYEFFSKEAGKVRDLYVVRDSRTGKSKGVAYVEFYLQESILKALGCNGRLIDGHGPIRIQASGAEKNRAAVASKKATASLQDKPIVLYIMGLLGPLAYINEAELKSLFQPFGELEYVDIGKCPYTGKGRGFARVMFRKAADAREAMACLNGYNIGDQTLQVGYLSGSLGERVERNTQQVEEEFLRTSQDRSRLMEALSRR